MVARFGDEGDGRATVNNMGSISGGGDSQRKA